MPKLVNLPNGKKGSFPDSMSWDEVQSALEQQFPPEQQEQPSNNQSALDVAGNLAEKYINKPFQATGLPAMATGFYQGLGNAALGLANLGIKGKNLVSENQTPEFTPYDIAPHNNVNAMVGELGSYFVPSALGRAPALIEASEHIQRIPVIADMIKSASNVFSKAPSVANKSANVLGNIGKGAAQGAIYNPSDQGLGAILGGAGTAAGMGIGAALPSLAPSNIAAKMFPAKNLTNEELLSNLAATEGTQTGLGSVLGEPNLSRQYENILSKVPFSGANEKLQSSAKEVVNRGQGILNKLLGENNPETVNDQVSQTLMKEFQRHQKEKNELYKGVNKMASESGLKLELPTFSKDAKKYTDAIESTNLLKYEPDFAKIFNKLKNYENPVQEIESPILSASGKPLISSTKYPTLEEANLLKGKLNQYAQTAGKSPDPSQRGLAKVYGDLAKSLKTDITSSIESHGNPELKNAYEQAEQNYKQKFSPFLDKEIYKHISGQKDPDMIVADFLKTSKSTDRKNKLLKLTSKLPDKEQKLIGYSYFSRALDKNGNLNPKELHSLIDKLGKKQLNVLIPDESLRKELYNYSKLYKMNTKGIDLLNNPPTGQQGLDLITSLLAHGGSSALGGAIGGVPGAVTGALVGSTVPGFLSKPIVNALSSPEFRQKTVNAILKKREKVNK